MDDGDCAARIFTQILNALGDTPALHMQFGRAYGNSDFAQRAVEEFRKAIAEDPYLPAAHYSLAAALLWVGGDEKNTNEAESELKKELKISPRDFLTFAALGKLAAGSHRNAEAEAYLKQAIVLNPLNPDAYLYLGQLYFESNRTVEAETALRQAIEHTTEIARNRYQIQKAHFLLGRILMQQHHADQAHAEMQIAHTLTDKTLSKDKRQLAGMHKPILYRHRFCVCYFRPACHHRFPSCQPATGL
jgi:tetratricopeptide (TPR) repeat protein